MSVPERDIPRFIALYQQGLLPVDKLMSERIGLDEINEGFDRLADGASVRQILLPAGAGRRRPRRGGGWRSVGRAVRDRRGAQIALGEIDGLAAADIGAVALEPAGGLGAAGAEQLRQHVALRRGLANRRPRLAVWRPASMIWKRWRPSRASRPVRGAEPAAAADLRLGGDDHLDVPQQRLVERDVVDLGRDVARGARRWAAGRAG